MNLHNNFPRLHPCLIRRFHLKQVLLLCLMLVTTYSFAKTSDINQTLNIEADSVEIREQQGISIYHGNVTISQGSMLIKGQMIHITAKENDIYTIKVQGTPARFTQQNDNNQEISAQSQEMIFSSSTGILTLDKEAILIQGPNKFTSEHIIYNTKQDIVRAGNEDISSETSEPKRVNIVIQPKQKNNEIDHQP